MSFREKAKERDWMVYSDGDEDGGEVFGIGVHVIKEVFQTVGKMPIEMERLKMCCSGAERMEEAVALIT